MIKSSILVFIHGDFGGMVINTFDWHLTLGAQYCF
jgi:hypothetical protein